MGISEGEDRRHLANVWAEMGVWSRTVLQRDQYKYWYPCCQVGHVRYYRLFFFQPRSFLFSLLFSTLFILLFVNNTASECTCTTNITIVHFTWNSLCNPMHNRPQFSILGHHLGHRREKTTASMHACFVLWFYRVHVRCQHSYALATPIPPPFSPGSLSQINQITFSINDISINSILNLPTHPPIKSDMSKIVPTTFYIYLRLFLPCSPHSPSLPVHAGYNTPSTCLQLMQNLSGTSQTAGRWVVVVTKRPCNFPRWSILY